MGDRKRKHKVKHNPQRPPRHLLIVLVKDALWQRLARDASDAKVSVSKWTNDLLCEGYDIPEKER